MSGDAENDLEHFTQSLTWKSVVDDGEKFAERLEERAGVWTLSQQVLHSTQDIQLCFLKENNK